MAIISGIVVGGEETYLCSGHTSRCPYVRCRQLSCRVSAGLQAQQRWQPRVLPHQTFAARFARPLRKMRCTDNRRRHSGQCQQPPRALPAASQHLGLEHSPLLQPAAQVHPQRARFLHRGSSHNRSAPESVTQFLTGAYPVVTLKRGQSLPQEVPRLHPSLLAVFSCRLPQPALRPVKLPSILGGSEVGTCEIEK